MTLEQLQEQLLALQEQNRQLMADKEATEQLTQTLTQRVSELQEHNQKLFMRVTAPTPATEPEQQELTIESYLDELLGGE